MVGDVDGPEADDAGAGGGVDVATRASRAFNATALIVSVILATVPIGEKKSGPKFQE